MTDLPGFLLLPDEELMLVFCVRGENLRDPARWCREMRDLYLEEGKPVLTAERAEQLMDWGCRLGRESDGDIEQQHDV